jgi:periplasmic copper chaperone A
MRDLLRSVAGPLICAVAVTGLLAAWAGTGGGGTLTRVSLQVTRAAVPMRAFTPQAADAVRTAATFVTIQNLSGTPDELIAARSPFARRIVLTQRTGSAGPPAQVGALVIPAHGTLALTPVGDDLVLEQPSPYESRATVPLTLTFRHSGTVTINAAVTGPGTP